MMCQVCRVGQLIYQIDNNIIISIIMTTSKKKKRKKRNITIIFNCKMKFFSFMTYLGR